MRKKKIAINIVGNEGWIGGLYYRINIIFSLMQNKNIMQNYEIIIFVGNDNKKLINECFPTLKTVLIESNGIYGKCALLTHLIMEGCNCIYVSASKEFSFLGITPISWIADFQHQHFPENFSETEIDSRDKYYGKIASSNFPLVLSSKDSYNDYMKYYAPRKKAYVVPFVSYIEPFVRNINLENTRSVLLKHNLIDNKYSCVMNQFWKHKNHIVVLEAIKIYFQNNPTSEFVFVFTGKIEDKRNPEYIKKLKTLFEDDCVNTHCKLLGFLSRSEQLALMKNAEYIIQPSLFEGWGTVVEDAKVLDKTILLSDIPVHHEQMNDKSILFDPYDPVALAKLIKEENQKEHIDDVEKGLEDMYRRAKEYSKEFEQLLKELERK